MTTEELTTKVEAANDPAKDLGTTETWNGTNVHVLRNAKGQFVTWRTHTTENTMTENNQAHDLESGDVLIDTSADENTPVKVKSVHEDGSLTVHVYRSETYWDEDTNDAEDVAWCLEEGIYVPKSEFDGELDIHVPGITEVDH